MKVQLRSLANHSRYTNCSMNYNKDDNIKSPKLMNKETIIMTKKHRTMKEIIEDVDRMNSHVKSTGNLLQGLVKRQKQIIRKIAKLVSNVKDDAEMIEINNLRSSQVIKRVTEKKVMQNYSKLKARSISKDKKFGWIYGGVIESSLKEKKNYLEILKKQNELYESKISEYKNCELITPDQRRTSKYYANISNAKRDLVNSSKSIIKESSKEITFSLAISSLKTSSIRHLKYSPKRKSQLRIQLLSNPENSITSTPKSLFAPFFATSRNDLDY